MDELYTAQTGLLQPLNLPLHQQLKGHLGYKKCWPRTLQGKSHTHTHTSSIIYLRSLQMRELDQNLDSTKYTSRSQEKLTVALRMAVRISSSVSPPRGSMDCKVRPKVSWNM